jgi:hypothetical protein
VLQMLDLPACVIAFQFKPAYLLLQVNKPLRVRFPCVLEGFLHFLEIRADEVMRLAYRIQFLFQGA